MVDAGPVKFPGLFTGEFWDDVDSNADTDESSKGDHDTRNAEDDQPEDTGADDDQPEDTGADDDQPEDQSDESSSSDGTQSPRTAKVKRESRAIPANGIVDEPVEQPVKRAKTESMHYCA
ncbi:MAG: hypothetical protein ACO3RW_10500 [Burkholderiaceae bacterium]